MPSLEAVAGQIMTAGVPVLFLDTCILLDIIRSTNRCLSGYAAKGLELLGLVTDQPPRCFLVVASAIPREWESNVANVTDEVRSHLAKIEEQSSHYHEACRALGIELGFARATYANQGLAEALLGLAGRLLEVAIRIDPNDECMVKAVKRVMNNVPPARSGGGQVMDCTITEECLAVCRLLHEKGYSSKKVFCTSNTKDYCDPLKSLHAGLKLEFEEVGLLFKPNLAGAVQEVSH